MHCDFEAITEINVNDPTIATIKQQVRRMPVAKTKNIANHGHDTEGSGVVGTPLEPCF
jgi:hypothetical protein